MVLVDRLGTQDIVERQGLMGKWAILEILDLWEIIFLVCRVIEDFKVYLEQKVPEVKLVLLALVLWGQLGVGAYRETRGLKAKGGPLVLKEPVAAHYPVLLPHLESVVTKDRLVFQVVKEGLEIRDLKGKWDQMVPRARKGTLEIIEVTVKEVHRDTLEIQVTLALTVTVLTAQMVYLVILDPRVLKGL